MSRPATIDRQVPKRTSPRHLKQNYQRERGKVLAVHGGRANWFAGDGTTSADTTMVCGAGMHDYNSNFRHDQDDMPTRHRPGYRDDPVHDPRHPADPYGPERYPDDPYYESEPELIRQRQRIVFQKIANVVWLFTSFLIAIIGLRVVLLLIDANEENAFVAWVYSTSGFFIRPFMNITDDPTFNGVVFEVNSLIAMLIYLLLIFLVLQLVKVTLDLTMPNEP